MPLDFSLTLHIIRIVPEKRDGMLNKEERKALLKIALRSILAAFEGKIYHPGELKGSLAEPRGAFVTLKKNGILKGCIGYVEPIFPLGETVARAAVAAAFEDPRFYPLQMEELEGLELEITVLTPPRKVNSLQEIVIGKHGLIAERGPFRGLLLPQVPVEHGWNLKEFLENTCLKAGLERDCWQRDTDFYTFEGEIFSGFVELFEDGTYNIRYKNEGEEQ